MHQKNMDILLMSKGDVDLYDKKLTNITIKFNEIFGSFYYKSLV